MKPYYNSKRILLIDRQLYYWGVFAPALRSAGLRLSTLDIYNYILLQNCLRSEESGLVALSHVRIRSEEQRLITQTLACKHHLLVLCLSLTSQVMRSLLTAIK